MVCGAIRSEPEEGRKPNGQGSGTSAPREIESRALFDGDRTVSIRHGAELYTLRITRADKLILTK